MSGRGAAAARMATAACAFGCAALAAAPAPTVAPRLELSGAAGALRISNSHSGRAIVSAGNMKPGGDAAGAVTVANRGGREALLFLRSSAARDRPGPGGGRLSRRLDLRVSEGRERVASGRIGAVAGCHAIGRIGAGARRRFTFTVSLRGGPGTGNSYARSAAAVDVRWDAVGRGSCALHGRQAVLGVSRNSRSGGQRANPGPERLPFTGFRLTLVLAGGIFLLLGGVIVRCRLSPS